jgi:hypothetical protein
VYQTRIPEKSDVFSSSLNLPRSKSLVSASDALQSPFGAAHAIQIGATVVSAAGKAEHKLEEIWFCFM